MKLIDSNTILDGDRHIPLDRANADCEALLQERASIEVGEKVDTTKLAKLQGEVAEEHRLAAEKKAAAEAAAKAAAK